jgi:hypothetical protein
MSADEPDLESLLGDLGRLSEEAALVSRFASVEGRLRAWKGGDQLAGAEAAGALEQLLGSVIELPDLAASVRPKIEAQLRRLPTTWG